METCNKKSLNKTQILIISVVAAIVISFVGFFAVLNANTSAVSKDSKEVIFEVVSGDTLNSIIPRLEETEFIYYSVYKVLKKEWLETIKSYMQSVIPTLPDSESKTKVAASINKIYERTTSNDIKSEAELRSEISTKQEAIRNSDPSINPDDIEWLDVLETACNIIF